MTGCIEEIHIPKPKPVAKPAPASTASGGTEVIEAGVGVGKKGHDYDKHAAGAIATPAKAYFSAREKIAFEIQIKHAVNLYTASDPNGKGPQSHEQFMEKIVKQQNIKLPELPDGHSYEWDVEKQILMVRRPAR